MRLSVSCPLLLLLLSALRAQTAATPPMPEREPRLFSPRAATSLHDQCRERAAGSIAVALCRAVLAGRTHRLESPQRGQRPRATAVCDEVRHSPVAVAIRGSLDALALTVSQKWSATPDGLAWDLLFTVPARGPGMR